MSLIPVLGQGLVYVDVINPDRKKNFKIWNLDLQVADVVCPMFVGKNLVEKRIFEIGEKNELIFSFSRPILALKKLTSNAINYFFSFYSRLSVDEKNILNYLWGYKSSEIDFVRQLLADLNIKDIEVGKDKDFLIVKNVKEAKLENIEDVISFLILAILFYGDVQVKEDAVLSFKIFWKIINPNIKEKLDLILEKLALEGFFIKADLLDGKDWPVYQFFSNDWELIENLLKISKETNMKNYPYENLLNKLDLFCQKYNCEQQKESFTWKIVSYG